MRYFAIAVDDDQVDFFVEENERQPFIHGVKQVMLDNVDFEDVETLS